MEAGPSPSVPESDHSPEMPLQQTFTEYLQAHGHTLRAFCSKHELNYSSVASILSRQISADAVPFITDKITAVTGLPLHSLFPLQKYLYGLSDDISVLPAFQLLCGDLNINFKAKGNSLLTRFRERNLTINQYAAFIGIMKRQRKFQLELVEEIFSALDVTSSIFEIFPPSVYQWSGRKSQARFIEDSSKARRVIRSTAYMPEEMLSVLRMDLLECIHSLQLDEQEFIREQFFIDGLRESSQAAFDAFPKVTREDIASTRRLTALRRRALENLEQLMSIRGWSSKDCSSSKMDSPVII